MKKADILMALVAALTTPAAFGQAEDVKVTTDTSVDCSGIESIARDLFRDNKTDEEKAIAAWYFVRRQCFHWPLIPTGDSIDLINSYGFGLCGNQSTMLNQIWRAGGLKSRILYAPGHVLAEAWYDGGWHLFDCQVGWFARKKDKSSVAGADDMKADPSIVLDAVKEGRASRPFFQCGDNPAGAVEWMEKHTVGGVPDVPKNRLVVNLRRGESITRTWSPEGKPWAPVGEATWLSPHHGCTGQATDADDPVNWRFWKPYAQVRQGNGASAVYGVKRTYANGRMVYAPDLAGGGFEDGLSRDGLRGMRRRAPGGDGPLLHPAEVGKPGAVTFSFDVPYVVVDAWVDAELVRREEGDACRVLVSSDGQSWTPVWNAEKTGSLKVAGASLRAAAHQRHRFFLRFEFQSARHVEGAGLRSFSVTSVFVNNPQALPHLMPGKNEVRVTAGKGVGRGLNFRLAWEEEGREKIHEARIQSSPYTFSAQVSGTDLPKMKSLTIAAEP